MPDDAPDASPDDAAGGPPPAGAGAATGAATEGDEPINLTHHFLIAMPGLEEGLFSQSVVYLCEHGEKGALGLIINKPSDIPLLRLFNQLDLPMNRTDLLQADVMHGGPVQTERGFVLHEPLLVQEEGGEWYSAFTSTLPVDDKLSMTTSKDVLEAISAGSGPQRVLMAMGYAAWGEGQLERELADNAWLTVPANLALIFDVPVAARYAAALALLGIAPGTLSTQAGHA